MPRTREDWRKDWYKALFDNEGNPVEILDFAPLHRHDGDSRAMRRQFPNGGDFWLVYTDTDPAKHDNDLEQIQRESRDRGVVLIRTTMWRRRILPNYLIHVGYITYSYNSVDAIIETYLADPTIPPMPAAVQDIVRAKLRDRLPLR